MSSCAAGAMVKFGSKFDFLKPMTINILTNPTTGMLFSLESWIAHAKATFTLRFTRHSKDLLWFCSPRKHDTFPYQMVSKMDKLSWAHVPGDEL